MISWIKSLFQNKKVIAKSDLNFAKAEPQTATNESTPNNCIRKATVIFRSPNKFMEEFANELRKFASHEAEIRVLPLTNNEIENLNEGWLQANKGEEFLTDFTTEALVRKTVDRIFVSNVYSVKESIEKIIYKNYIESLKQIVENEVIENQVVPVIIEKLLCDHYTSWAEEIGHPVAKIEWSLSDVASTEQYDAAFSRLLAEATGWAVIANSSDDNFIKRKIDEMQLVNPVLVADHHVYHLVRACPELQKIKIIKACPCCMDEPDIEKRTKVSARQVAEECRKRYF